MRELKENQEPLNVKAREFLKQVGESPEPDGLYCLQLALWGLTKGKVAYDPEIMDSIYLLMEKPQDLVLRWLEREPAEEDPEDQLIDLLTGNETPEALAWSVLDRLSELLADALGRRPLL